MDDGTQDVAPPSIEAETGRATARREALHLRQGPDDPKRPWALCLSGGGIRSATFCLGVMQGLSRTPSPEALRSVPPDGSCEPGPTNHLLAQFDFLSTVSGGGYIGAFFSSLFVTGRLSGDEAESDQVAAGRAYQVLQEDPPERMHTATVYEPTRPGRAALAWLRDNGRYLTPTGGGDMGYAAAISLRNWLAVQFVVATMMLPLLSLSLFLRLAAARYPEVVPLEAMVDEVRRPIVWSSTWVAAGAVLLALAIPFGIAYWFAHPAKGRNLGSPASSVTMGWVSGFVLGLACLALWRWGGVATGESPLWARAFLVVGLLDLAACLFYWLTLWLGRPKNVSAHRVLLSWALTRSLQLVGILGALAIVETLALSLLHLRTAGLAGLGLSTSAVTGAVVWVVRFAAGRLGADASPGKGQSRAARRAAPPLQALAAVLAIVLWAVVAIALEALLLWLYSDGSEDISMLFVVADGTCTLGKAGWGSAILLLVALLVGLFPGFVNLSTYQPLYSARLTRAYLGASNHQRFAEASARSHNVAEPAHGDILDTTDLYRNPLAPIHFIIALRLFPQRNDAYAVAFWNAVR